MEFSVVVPIYNEAKSLTELTDRLCKVFKFLGKEKNFEILFVDDGSTDSSKEILRRLNQENSCVRYLFLRKNYGKSFAITTAFMYVKGKFVITMDGDLQDLPEEIPKMITKLNEGYDLIVGWRRNRHDRKSKIVVSWIFNMVSSWLSGIKMHDFNCGFKICNSKVAKTIVIYGQQHRFIPLLAYLMGFKVGEVPIRHETRKYGVSKYSLFRYQGIFDLFSILLIYKYRFRPLHFFGIISSIFVIPSLIVLMYLIGMHFYGIISMGKGYLLFNRPMLSLSMTTFILGINIFMTGFICDFIIYHQGNQNTISYMESLIDEVR